MTVTITNKDLDMDFETFLRTFYEFNENGDLELNTEKFIKYYNEHKKWGTSVPLFIFV